MTKKSFSLILFLILFMFTSLTVFASDETFTDFIEFSQSNEFSEIESMESEILDTFKNLYEMAQELYSKRYRAKRIFPEHLDFANISKVYVDTNIEDINTADKSAIEDILNQSTYVWVIPMLYENHNFYITLAKGLPLDESKATALTDSEKVQVLNNVDKWIITEIAERPIEPYPVTLEEKASNTAIDDIVLIGGIPGMQMPIALGFDNDKASSWIKVGYQYPVMETIPTTFSSQRDIYDYDVILEKLHEYKESSGVLSGGATGNFEMKGENSNIRRYVAGGSLILICCTLLFYFKKKIQ